MSGTSRNRNNYGKVKRRGSAPYRKNASVENYGGRVTAGLVFAFLACCTAVSYFVQDGAIIIGIHDFMSGILGYGYWACALAFLWAACILFKGSDRMSLRLVCVLLIPVLFSAFIDVLTVNGVTGAFNLSVESERLFAEGKEFRSGGVISGLLVHGMVALLSKAGTGIILVILIIICVVMAVSEPDSWFMPQTSSKSKKKSSGKKAPPVQDAKSRSWLNSLVRMTEENPDLITLPDKVQEKKAEKTVPLGADDFAPVQDAPEEGASAKRAKKARTADMMKDIPLFDEEDYSSSKNKSTSAFSAADASAAENAKRPSAAKSTREARPVGGFDGSAPVRQVSGGRRNAAAATAAAAERQPKPAMTGRKPVFTEEEEFGYESEKGGYTGRHAAPLKDGGSIAQEERVSVQVPQNGAQTNRGGAHAERAGAQANTAPRPTGAVRRPIPVAKPQQNEAIEIEEEDEGITLGSSNEPISTRKAASSKADMKQPPKITQKDIEKEARKVAAAISADTETLHYSYPATSLLMKSKPAGRDSEEEIVACRERLENALHSFGIFSSVVNVTHGPTVTRYDIELEQGVKLTKVTNLSNDIALSLGVASVRIAPIPDEISTVGIEVPNKIVNTVGLREIIESDNFVSAKSRLTFAIGMDIAGNAICGNISKLPHLLIAGTTGSGKSVCMNSLIISLLYKSRPDEVKFIMIDPKMVELGIYNKIPHLYVPVVTDPKKAAGALQWAVVEMLKRYRLFSEAGVRDLETYNKLCRANGEEPLPQMVIVIDELADLMMAASKEVEESICRIAQMGRASGQHLVIATQRPSADVITGLMKANIPSRIAFAVSSTLESRIILDQGGADKLIGHGDMLYAPIGCGKPLRVQGAFVSDEEREDIINFISKNSDAPAQQNDELNQFMDKALESGKKGASDSAASGEEKGAAGEYDEMLPQAVDVVMEMKQCSVSMLQRRLKLGYARAARVVDQMEELGVVGPYEGAKPRSVPMDRETWESLREELGLAASEG